MYKKIIVFTRNKVEFIFDKEYKGSTQLLKLNDLEHYFNELPDKEIIEIELPDELPTWDIFYSNNGFSLGLLLNDKVMIDNQLIHTMLIDSISFSYDHGNSVIKLLDGSLVLGYINFDDIKIIGDRIFKRTGIQFMKLNQMVHSNTKSI